MCQAVLLFCSLSAICLLDTAHLQVLQGQKVLQSRKSNLQVRTCFADVIDSHLTTFRHGTLSIVNLFYLFYLHLIFVSSQIAISV